MSICESWIFGFLPYTRAHLDQVVQKAEADTLPSYKLAFTAITLYKHTRLSSAVSASGLDTLNTRQPRVLRHAFVLELFRERRVPDLQAPWLRNEAAIPVSSVSTSRDVRFRPFLRS